MHHIVFYFILALANSGAPPIPRDLPNHFDSMTECMHAKSLYIQASDQNKYACHAFRT